MAGAIPAAIAGSQFGIFGGGNDSQQQPRDFWSNPQGGYPGMGGMPGMGAMPGGDFSRMPGAMPRNWQNRIMPKGGGMAADQTPGTLNQMATAMSRGKTYDPMQAMSGMPMNPRYAQFAGMQSPGGGKGQSPGVMGAPMPSPGGGKGGGVPLSPEQIKQLSVMS